MIAILTPVYHYPDSVYSVGEYIDGLVPARRNSIANALELH